MLTAATAESTIHAHPAAAVRSNSFAQGPLGLIGASTRFARNSEIYSEDDPAEYLYQVISGAVRTCRTLDDGRRQIGSFYLPGDIFDVEATEVHLASAEAIREAHVVVAKRSAVMARAEYEKDFAEQLWTLAVRELQRMHEHSMVLMKSAEERVAGFLLEMAGRNAAAQSIELPMTRQDIADYLGLTIETVSRTLSQLAQSGTIALETSRRILLRDRVALSRINA
ncbi:helix-turn-helix domain-containing protein [Bradyrhizobium sp. 25ACV]